MVLGGEIAPGWERGGAGSPVPCPTRDRGAAPEPVSAAHGEGRCARDRIKAGKEGGAGAFSTCQAFLICGRCLSAFKPHQEVSAFI